MDQIIAALESIDFNAIITWITDFLAQIDFQVILEKIATLIAGSIA